MTRIWTPGYAPPEQYSYRANRHPNADIYSLCASMYELLTGNLPADALDRVNAKTSTPNTQDILVPPRQLVPQISPLMERIILIGMKLKVEERFQDADHLIAALNGNFLSPLLIKGRHLVKEGKLSPAAFIYERCVLEEPDNQQAAVERALVLTHLGDTQTETATQQALKFQPQDGRLYGILGLLHCRQARWQEAVIQLRQGVNLAPDEAWIWANLAWALAKCGNWPQSEFAVNKALMLDKNLTFASGLKAWIDVSQQQWMRTIQSAQQAINSPNGNSIKSWVYPCLVLALHKTNHSGLEKTLQEYIHQMPDSAFGSAFQGWLLASKGQWANALAVFPDCSSPAKRPILDMPKFSIIYEQMQDYQERSLFTKIVII